MTGVLDGADTSSGLAVATGVIGAGAAMLPTGAAAGASAPAVAPRPGRRAADQRGDLSSQPDNPGLDRYEGEQWPAQPGAVSRAPRTLRQLWADEDDARAKHSPAGSGRPVCAPSRAASPAGRSS